MVAKAKPKRKKDKKSRSGSQLSFTVPANIERLGDYVKNDLLTPNHLDDEKEAYAPLDFTSISSREIGKQHSAWAVRQAHLLFLIGNLRAEIGNVKHDLKNEESRWMAAKGDEYKTKYAADAAMSRSKAVRTLRKQLTRAEASLTRFEALSESYKVLREAASREMTRRMDERASKD